MIALLFGEFLQDVDHFYVHFLSELDWFNQLQKSFLIILRINSVFILKFKSLQFSTNPKFYRVYPNSFCFVFYWCYRVLPSFTGFPLNGLTLFQRHFFLHFHCSIFVPGASVSSPLACGKPPPPPKKKKRKKNFTPLAGRTPTPASSSASIFGVAAPTVAARRSPMTIHDGLLFLGPGDNRFHPVSKNS